MSKSLVECLKHLQKLVEFSAPQYCLTCRKTGIGSIKYLYYNDLDRDFVKEIKKAELFNSEKAASKVLAEYLSEKYPYLEKQIGSGDILAFIKEEHNRPRIQDENGQVLEYEIMPINLSDINPGITDMFATPEFAKEIADGIDVEGKVVVLDIQSVPSYYRKYGDLYRLATVYSKDTIGDTRTYFFSLLASPIEGFRGSRNDIMGIASPEQVKEYVKKYPDAGKNTLKDTVGYDMDSEYKQAISDALNEVE